MNQIIEHERLKLRQNMAKNNLAPSEAIIPDNISRRYWKKDNDYWREARYTATLHPFEDDPDNPILICSYGWLDERGGGYSYSSLMEQ